MIGRRSVLLRSVALLGTGAALACCGEAPPKPPPPPVVTVDITGSAAQNPDSNGTAQPVAVRLYQLTSSAKFEHADFFALVDHEQQTLGAESVASQTLILAPSESRSLTIEPGPTVRLLGVVVEYRDIDNAQWRAFAPVAANGPTKLLLGIGRLAVTLKPAA